MLLITQDRVIAGTLSKAKQSSKGAGNGTIVIVTMIIRKKGFTLIELLIASAILSVVLVTVYSAFRTGIFGYRNIDEVIKDNNIARLILERINTDLRNSFCYSKEESFFSGSQNEIEFLCLSDVFLKDKLVRDYSRISYKFQNNKIYRLCRSNKESLNEDFLAEPEEISSNIESLVFNYGYLNETTNLIEWKDIWQEDKKNPPQLVRVKLTLEGKRKPEFERTIFFSLL